MRAFERRARSRSLGLVCLIACVSIVEAASAQDGTGEWTFSPADDTEPASPPTNEKAAAPTSAPAEPVEEPALIPLRPTDDPTADQASSEGAAPGSKGVEKRILHGFRMGYLYVANYDRKPPGDDPEKTSLKERYGMRTPHQYLLGYEIMGRLIGHGWLNVVVVGNVLVSGLEQSKFWPSANLLIGFEFDQSFQVGLGPNFTLEEDKPAHLVMAGGWTPRIGNFYVPVHGFFIPDVDGNHRMGATVGVNW